MPKICLNMIVKDEAANIARCLASVMPFIDCGVIVDTGSSDNTKELIKNWFSHKGKPIELSEGPFINFGQARNMALHRARESKLEWDYLLLVDADMELKAKDETPFEGITHPAYSFKQGDGKSSLNNIRLLRRDQTVEYEGVTHEWLHIEHHLLKSVYLWDHCSGPSRADKAKRDIELLLTSDLSHHQNLFNLAHSYYSDQQWQKAAEMFGKRIEMGGGWGEQVWNSMLYFARCLLMLKDEPSFVHQALTCFHIRPTRAEPLYDLARYWRANGTYHTSLIFSQLGLVVPYPVDDNLFVEDYVYHGGMKHEYNEALKALGLPIPEERKPTIIRPVKKLLAKR